MMLHKMSKPTCNSHSLYIYFFNIIIIFLIPSVRDLAADVAVGYSRNIWLGEISRGYLFIILAENPIVTEKKQEVYLLLAQID